MLFRSEVFDAVEADLADRALVITGAEDAFCSGADLTEGAAGEDDVESQAQLLGDREQIRPEERSDARRHAPAARRHPLVEKADRLFETSEAKARQLGLSLALITRVLLLMSLTWIMGLTKPLFMVPLMNRELTGRDLVCFCAPRRCHADALLAAANPTC